MNYMKDHVDLRADLKKLLPGARSVVMVLQNYFISSQQEDPSAPVIARYAYGQDYHSVIQKKLEKTAWIIYRLKFSRAREGFFVILHRYLKSRLPKGPG